MIDFDFILETLVTICLSVYYLLEGMVKAVLPINWMPKKDLSRETVLITGAGKHQSTQSFVKNMFIKVPSRILRSFGPA